MRIRAVPFLAGLFLFGCSAPYVPREVAGTYSITYAGVTESLTLRADGTYVHEWDAHGGSGVEHGGWQIEHIEGDCTRVVLSEYRHRIPIPLGEARGEWRPCLTRDVRGRPAISVSDDLGIAFRRR